MQQEHYDIAIVGAGPQGLMFATWAKSERPQLRVAVLDRSASIGHKIGESTLSGFCRAVRSVGVRHEALQRLFYVKNGLGYLYGDAQTELETAPEYITETFDETFQVERRVCDGLLEANALRVGVEILRGRTVNVADSEFAASGNRLVYSDGEQTRSLHARVVVDASGPASVLGRRFGGYLRGQVPFQTSSAWAYFKDVKWLADYTNWRNVAQFPRDEYTQHVCFKEGWLWYIPIVSWQRSSEDKLRAMSQYLADPQTPMLSRDELAARFDCHYEQIWSIGISLRSDRDQVLERGPQAAFDHYAQAVPMIGKILEGATPLRDHYPAHNPFSVRKRYRRHAREVAGDGWVLIGDAAFFIDPLRSPGLTGGMATTYYAVQEVLAALDAGDSSSARFDRYRSFVRELYEVLEEQNQIAYMSHNHPKALSIVRRFGEVSSRSHFDEICDEPYQLADTNVWGHLWPEHRARQRLIWEIMREEELAVDERVPVEQQTPRDYEPMVERLERAIGAHLDRNMALNPYIANNPNERGALAPALAIAASRWTHPALVGGEGGTGPGPQLTAGWDAGVIERGLGRYRATQ